MKFPKSLLLGLTGVMTIAATPALSQSSLENKVPLRCETDNNGVLATVAYNPSNDKQKESIITWKQGLVDSQNIKQDCQNALEKLAKYLASRNPAQTEIYLAVETVVRDKSNSQNKIHVHTVCLASETGGTCNPDGSDQLVRISIELEQGKTDDSLAKIINPNFALIDGAKVRTVGVTYSKIRSRTFWDRLGFRF